MSRPTSNRRVACARCGAAFECGAETGACWCAEEQFRLPMPTGDAGDCLCPACLREAAQKPRYANRVKL